MDADSRYLLNSENKTQHISYIMWAGIFENEGGEDRFKM
jgi:hypothetical protein